MENIFKTRFGKGFGACALQYEVFSQTYRPIHGVCKNIYVSNHFRSPTPITKSKLGSTVAKLVKN